MTHKLIILVLFLSTLFTVSLGADEDTDLKEYIEDKLVIARSYYQQGFAAGRDPVYFDRAIEEYTNILKTDPWNKEAIVGMADIYTSRKNYDEAERLYRQSIKLDPWNVDYHLKLGFHYIARDLREEALEEANWVIEYDPENVRARLLRGIVYEKTRDPADAIDEYLYAIRHFEAEGKIAFEIDARLRLGALYLKEKLIFDGVEQYEEVVKIEPRFIRGYLELANVYYRLGRIDKAISTLKLLLRHGERVPQAHVMLALIYFYSGDYDASFAYFKKAEAFGVSFGGELLETFNKVKRAKEESVRAGEQE